jgi:hypothetical protein
MKLKQFKAGWGKKMPSTSKKQHNFMAAIAKNPAFAKKVGIKQSVGEHFLTADKGKKFGSGGMAKSDMKEDMKADIKQDKAIVKKAFKMHDAQEHKGGKGTDLSKLKKGGMAMKKMAKGGMAKCDMASGGMSRMAAKGEHPVQKRAKEGAEMIKMAKGGSASARADGCAVKGKTKGKMMCMGGMAKKK